MRPSLASVRSLIRVAAVVAALMGSYAAVRAQNGLFGSQASPMAGSTGGLSVPAQAPHLSISPNTPAHIHLGPTGQPCLTMGGVAEQQTMNPNIYNHMIIGLNACSQSIKVKVCYYGSDDNCTKLDVPAYGRKEALLGIMPAMKDFRFQYTEQFDQQYRPF